MLAIAANGFNKPSETFIRAHARHIAPGDTMLIAERRELKMPIAAPLILFSKRFPIFVPEGAGAGAVMLSALSPARWGKSRDSYLAGLLRQNGVTALMAEYGSTAVHVMEAAQLAGCKLFVHFHGVDASSMLRDPAVVTRYQRLFALADGVIAPSAFLARNLAEIGCPDAKLHVVPCGVDVGVFEPGTPDPNRFLSVGRFTEKKSPLSTIQAFATVLNSAPNATLEMMGDGPLLGNAEAEIERLGIAANVILHGMVTPGEVKAAMGRCGVFVQHSVTAANGDIEGLPVAILEAMAAGLPVVATRHSGIPEAVEDNVTGLLVDEFDVAGMAACMARLCADPALAKTYGTAGRARVISTFSQEKTIGQLQDIMGLSRA